MIRKVLRELVSAIRVGFSSHVERPRHLLLIAAGFVIGALVLVLLLALASGFDRLGDETGDDDVAIVFAANARNESDSALKPEVATLVADLPGVARDSDGRPVVAPQFVASAKLRRRDGEVATALVRGVTPAIWTLVGMHPPERASLQRSAANQLLAGTAAARSFVATDVDAQIKIRNAVWTVVDHFEGRGLWDSELWADIAPLQATFNAPAALSVLWVKLNSPAEFATFQAALEGDKRLRDLRTEMQRDYYGRQVRFVSHFLRIATAAVAAALGLGAALAIANALTLALIARRRELAILRALGWQRRTLGAALLLEVMLISVPAALFAIAAAWLMLGDLSVGSSTGVQTVNVTMAITPGAVAWTLEYVLLLGATSAIWPAWQAVRTPIIRALHDD